MTTLVIDAGQSIVGVYSAEDREYIGYRGSRISEALEQVRNADEVICFPQTGISTANGVSADTQAAVHLSMMTLPK
jgi:hypothetical protein